MASKRIITHNFWLKLFSLMLAGMIWYAVFSIQDEPRNVPGFQTGVQTRTFDQVAVQVLKSPSDTRLYKVSPAAVNVTVTADLKTLESLTPHDLQVFINLSSMHFESRKHDVHINITQPVVEFEVSPGYVFIDRLSP